MGLFHKISEEEETALIEKEFNEQFEINYQKALLENPLMDNYEETNTFELSNGKELTISRTAQKNNNSIHADLNTNFTQ